MTKAPDCGRGGAQGNVDPVRDRAGGLPAQGAGGAPAGRVGVSGRCRRRGPEARLNAISQAAQPQEASFAALGSGDSGLSAAKPGCTNVILSTTDS